MSKMKSILLSGSAVIVGLSAAQAADLPVKKAVPIEYVRVCGAYGAGFFYIPGTDTCLRVSGRARMEVGYSPSLYRGNSTGGNVNNQGDTTGYRGLLRINLDARTQTDYGTLRAFIRLEGASRTGASGSLRSGTQERIGQAYGATGQDQTGRDQQFMNVDKAFVQFAGLTAGRASSFFDFYAHDFEIIGYTAGSDVQSTNLLAYTYAAGDGLSFTASMEDPTFRRNGIYSQEATQLSAQLGTPARILASVSATGVPTYDTVDVNERNRMPDFVGVARYDQAWGSLQISAAVHELNTGAVNYVTSTNTGGNNLVTGANIATLATLPSRGVADPKSEYGYAVQGGVKVNLPFIAPGDALYLQGAYGKGATTYTGYSTQAGSAVTNINTLNGSPFNQWVADASLNPFTGKIELAESFTATVSFLHYWTPQWRSAFFSSYGENNFAKGAREANYLAYAGSTAAPGNSGSSVFLGGNAGVAGTGLNSRSFAVSPVLRDNYQIIAGASVIYSPVKDLDIGIEGVYNKIGVKSGRVIDVTQAPLTVAQVNAGLGRTVSSEDQFYTRFRVQRDF